MLRAQYMEILARITEKAKRLDAFMIQAGTAKAAEKTARAMHDESEDIEKAIKAALDVEDGLDFLLSHVTQKDAKPN